MSDDTLQRDTSQISQLFHPLPRRFPNAHGRTAAMTADSNFGQRTAAANARVAKLMSHTVEIAGFAFDLNDFPATHTQLSTTDATAMLVIHPCALANQATMEPVAPVATAGKAMGNTQQTPHASAAVAAVAAAAPAARSVFAGVEGVSQVPQHETSAPIFAERNGAN
jgi:hypothetical protein